MFRFSVITTKMFNFRVMRSNFMCFSLSIILKGKHHASISSKRSVGETAVSTLRTIEEERKNFILIYPEVKSLLLKIMPPFNVPKFEKFFDYNVPTGRGYRALLALRLYNFLASDSVKKTVTQFQLYSTAWLIEMLQAVYLLIDDALDESVYRRGKLCWYKENTNTLALDVVRLYIGVFKLLEKVSSNTHYYRNMESLFHEMSLRVLTGEAVDYFGKHAVHSENLEAYYHSLVRLKTDYSCRLPFDAAMFLAGYEEIPFSDKLYKIYGDLSYVFQMLNDRLDYQDAPSDGKIKGEDIRNGDLTWFLIRALEIGSPEQKMIIQEHYGRDNDDSILKVYEVYEDLRLMDKYIETQADMISKIKTEISEISDEKLRDFLFHLPDSVFSWYIKNY